ncbi:MAG TPA: hypothetical protein VMF86_13425 [Stellaceae bacterium]|nr:hypothetical protein [Stellaceae bacterium]
MALLLALAVASCQPLPHPFADDKPPAALLQVRDTSGISIAPVVGRPAAVGERLADAMAKAFLKRDIPASAKTSSLDSYQLYGRLVESRPRDGRVTLLASWWLYDAAGKIVGKRSAEIVAAAGGGRSAAAAPIARLASLSADKLAPLIIGKQPAAPPPTPEAGRIRVAIGKVVGAPGDGASSLQTAITAVLQRQNLAIVARGGKADLHITADVTVSPAAQGRQHVKIVWHVRRGDGTEIGTVAQQNDVPQGQLAGPWGAVAYDVASAAAGGLMQLVERGAPPASATQAANRPQ